MPKKKLTSRDIAKMANVSHMTVSRVLNTPEKVHPKSREKVLNIIKRYNYKIDARGRNLASKKSNLIALIVPDISNIFYAELARSIEDKAQGKGYNITFCSLENKPERMERYVDIMINAAVDGIIFAGSRLKEPTIEKLIDECYPLVLVNRKLRGENHNYVVVDNKKGAFKVIEHLINLNYRKIAIISGPSNLSTGYERFRGFKTALKSSGITLDKNYIVRGSFTRETGYKGAQKLLTLKNRPDAIFASNDYIAMGVFDAVEELGLRVPEDIALVGFDDTVFASNKRINLTTVSQRTYEMGELGVDILVDFIENKESTYMHQIILEPKFIIRESCGNKLHKR